MHRRRASILGFELVSSPSNLSSLENYARTTRVYVQTTAEGRGGDRSLVAACTRLLLRFLLPVQGGAADVLGGLPAATYT